jgi:UDP-N-acetylmuramoyl-L-alanyl-D-glutamate--2,6-diaminopimelate ligase
MGRIARALADNIVITSDNPRSEPSEQIIDDILLGIDDMHNVNVEQDRAAAIAFAVAQAQAGDLLLIAGKGHEQFQIIGDMQLPFSDVDVVRKNLLAESQQ